MASFLILGKNLLQIVINVKVPASPVLELLRILPNTSLVHSHKYSTLTLAPCWPVWGHFTLLIGAH